MELLNEGAEPTAQDYRAPRHPTSTLFISTNFAACAFSENMPLYGFDPSSKSQKLTFRCRHLLSKKSWNVYGPTAIARVKRDEAAAAAREAEEERRMQETDAERRLAILRGEIPPPLPPGEEDADGKADRRRGGHVEDGGRERKRRRLAGENDTDRDIRLAKADIEDGGRASDRLARKESKAPIVDRDGLMDLFRDDQPGSKKVEKNAEAEAEKAKRERQLEDQYTMRFENAAGRSGFKETPWYSKTDEQSTEEGKTVDEDTSGTNKDVWGNPDPRRNEREKARLTVNDPLTMMKRAQQQLKQAENDKRKWQEQRDRETKESKNERRHRKSEKKHRRESSHDADGIEGFDLDTKPRTKPDEERVNRHNHRSHRSRESENDSDHNTPHRHRHHRARNKSRSRSRDKREKTHRKYRRYHSETY